jgi:VanZ family protein
MNGLKRNMQTFLKTHQAFRYLPAPLLALTLWLLSSRSTLPMPQGVFGLDKVAHFTAYAALAFALGLWPKRESWKAHPLRTALLIVALASVYGGIDELHQSFVPGRDASVYDWIADTLGAGFGVAVFAWWHSWYGKARPQT